MRTGCVAADCLKASWLCESVQEETSRSAPRHQGDPAAPIGQRTDRIRNLNVFILSAVVSLAAECAVEGSNHSFSDISALKADWETYMAAGE